MVMVTDRLAGRTGSAGDTTDSDKTNGQVRARACVHVWAFEYVFVELLAWHAIYALGLEFGSVWNCLWGHALKRSPGFNRKSKVSHPGPRFLSSATCHSLPKKHYNGLNLNQT